MGSLVFLVCGLLLWGCGVDEEGERLQEGPLDEAFVDATPPVATGKADELTVRWEVLGGVEIPSHRLEDETRRVLSTPRAFEDFFGFAAPAAVDFDEQWVFFFTPGAEYPGLRAELDVIRYASSHRSLQIITKTTELQGDCSDELDQVDSLLAVFSQPNLRPQSVRYYHSEAFEACASETCIDALREEFEAATDDLWYPSESDYPFQFFHLEGVTELDGVTALLLSEVAGVEALEPFEEWGFEEFFSWIARPG